MDCYSYVYSGTYRGTKRAVAPSLQYTLDNAKDECIETKTQ